MRFILFAINLNIGINIILPCLYSILYDEKPINIKVYIILGLSIIAAIFLYYWQIHCKEKLSFKFNINKQLFKYFLLCILTFFVSIILYVIKPNMYYGLEALLLFYQMFLLTIYFAFQAVENFITSPQQDLQKEPHANIYQQKNISRYKTLPLILYFLFFNCVLNGLIPGTLYILQAIQNGNIFIYSFFIVLIGAFIYSIIWYRKNKVTFKKPDIYFDKWALSIKFFLFVFLTFLITATLLYSLPIHDNAKASMDIVTNYYMLFVVIFGIISFSIFLSLITKGSGIIVETCDEYITQFIKTCFKKK